MTASDSRALPVFGPVDRRALVAVATQFFVNGALFASFFPRLPEIRDKVDITVDQVGLFLSIAGICGLLSSAVVGRVIARFGTRWVMAGGAVVVSLSLPVIGFARTVPVLVIGLVGMLAFDVFVDVAMNMQGSWLSARRNTPVMSRLHGLWSLGTVAGGLTASRIAAAGVSLSVHLSGAAAILLVAVIFVSRNTLRTDEAPVEAGASDRPSRLGGRRWVLALFVLAGLSASAVEATSIDWAAFRFADDYGSSAGFAALGYVAVTGGMTAGRFGGDWADVRLGSVRLGWLSALLAGAGLAAATLVAVEMVNLAGYFVAGVGVASLLPAIYDRAAKQPGRPGAGLGALTAGLRVAGVTLPVLVGALAATSLSVGAAIALVTIPSVVIFTLVTRLLPAPGSYAVAPWAPAHLTSD